MTRFRTLAYAEATLLTICGLWEIGQRVVDRLKAAGWNVAR